MSNYREIIEEYKEEGRFRVLPPDRSDAEIIDLASNDYMGLGARYEDFSAEFNARYGVLPYSSSASRLLSRHQAPYARLEQKLGDMYGREALLFNSGYHANVGITSALNVPGTIFLADKLIHASAIDGLTMRKCEFERWRHNDTKHLRRLIEKHYETAERIVVIAEAVYSMDGDCAPLRELVALRREFPKVILYIDEAHSFGVFGKGGAGLCVEEDLIDDVDILMGTFGKACASSGAFAAVSSEMKDYLINSARSFIFSTAIPPVCVAWTEFMIEKLSGMDAEREHLKQISERFRVALEEMTGVQNPSSSQIVPLLIGDAEKAVAFSHKLEEAGVLALPIRKPTVPAGTERIRFSLHAGLRDEEVAEIERIIKKEL
jgi:8-amino-7-oxononanoate synthase